MVPAPFKRYTITFTVATNWTINHVLFFWKHDFPKIQDMSNVPLGTILSLKYKDENGHVHHRGHGKSNDKCFSNTTSVNVFVGKIINVKLPSFGKIQITGCLEESQAYKGVHAIWKAIQAIEEKNPGFCKLPPDEPPKIIFNPVMNNVSVNIGFEVNRQKLQTFLYRCKEMDFILPTKDERYAGTKVETKIQDISHIPLVKQRFLQGKWYSSNATMNDFLALLNAKSRKEESRKTHQHVILIFHSGKLIYIAPRFELMPKFYDFFLKLLHEHRNEIEETCQAH